MCAWSLRFWRLIGLPFFLLPFFLLQLLHTRICVNSSPESAGSRHASWASQPTGDPALSPAWREAHGDPGGSCAGGALLLLTSSASSTAVTQEQSSSSSSVTAAIRPVAESGDGPPRVSPPLSSALGHALSSPSDLSPTRPRRLRAAVDAHWRGQGTGVGPGLGAAPGPGGRPRKMFGWGDFSASVRTARLHVLITAKMVDHGNGSVSVHFRHNATGREGSMSVSLEPPGTPLHFAPHTPSASQETRSHQQQRYRQRQQQDEQHQKQLQQHDHNYQQQQQWNEKRLQQEQNEQTYQRNEQQVPHQRQNQQQLHQRDVKHQQQQQHRHQQEHHQNHQQQRHHQNDQGQHYHPQHQHYQEQHRQQQRPREQQEAELKESRDPGTFHCRVEYEKVDRALKSAPCAEQRGTAQAGSSRGPGGPVHSSPGASLNPGVGTGPGGSCYREQVQSHVSWICSKPFSAFCIYIAFQGADYRLAHKVCPDLHAARTHPSG